jgi:hypothetical protein
MCLLLVSGLAVVNPQAVTESMTPAAARRAGCAVTPVVPALRAANEMPLDQMIISFEP